MSTAFLVQTAASVAAIALMVALAAWARIARPQPPLDEARARALIAEEFPDRAIEAVWVASDAAAAVAKSGSQALVLVRFGDGYVARQVAWTDAAAAVPRGGRITLDLADVAAPRAVIALAAWPPKDLAA
ncbi:MAG TPA: hypothetical protein VHV27_08100 [Phenylobacterium sp.]|jgi:hypothetical protein|nr:hypothetical protein [Phenylobacterium sp.]